MARGRMVNKTISTSKQVNDLPLEAQLLFTWLIPHLDVNGCFYGDADLVKNLVFPRKKYTKKQVENWLTLMENTVAEQKNTPTNEFSAQHPAEMGKESPLIIRYVVNGEQFIYMPGFTEHQIGLRRDKEKAEFPTFDGKNTEKLRKEDGKSPSEGKGREVNRREVEGEEKGKEGKDAAAAFGEVFRFYEQEMGTMLTPTIADGIKDWLNEHPADKVKEAIKEAVMAGVRKPSYINAILESWKLEGYKKTPKRGPPGINDPKLQHILDDVEAA